MLLKIKKLIKKSFVYKLLDKEYNRVAQKRLNNTNFTILCNNCIGGLIYHRLGERFNSPTIDISIDTPDFANFLQYFDYYISQEMIEFTPREDGIPRGMIKGNADGIPDIIINLIHYPTFEIGKEKWEQRKKRIIPENTYVIMYDIGDMNEADYDKAGYASQEDLEKFNRFPCKNKVLLTRNPECDNPYAFYIQPDLNGPYPLVYLKKGLDGRDYYEKHFDFVNFVNQ